MGKAFTASPLAHTSTAEFRAWLQELNDLLVSAGFVRTDDTGQVNIDTVNRPSLGDMAGYFIYRTNDAFSHIYAKIEVGTSNDYGHIPLTKFQFANGTNGAGILTGAMTAKTTVYLAGPPAGNLTSRACTGNGYAWCAFKMWGNYTLCGFAIKRFCDGAGAPTNQGFVVYWNGGGSYGAQQVRNAGPFVSGTAFNYCLTPGDVTAGAAGADVQFWRHYVATPIMRVNPFVLTCDIATFPEAAERPLEAIAGSPMNFISVGPSFFKNAAIGNVNPNHTLALPWTD